MSDRELAQLCARAYRRATHETATVEALLEGDVLAFRGTDEASDLSDLVRFLPIFSIPLKALVHRGRYTAVYEFWFDFHADLPSGLVLAGHSLGGCDAILFGALMARWRRPPKRIVTFGAPPIAGPRIKAILKDIPLTIYQGDRDTRAKHPPPVWRLLYRHPAPPVTVPGCRHGRDEYARLVG